MTEVAMAVLFSGDPETGKTSMDVFRSSDETTSSWPDGRTMDPYHRAAALRHSCAPDMPERVWAISINEPARTLMAAERLRGMDLGLTEDQIQEALGG